MKKSETGINAVAGGTMTNDVNNRERLSALVDGQLEGDELDAALAFASDEGEGHATWQLYHLVGDVLRSSDLARPSNPAFMSRIRDQIAQEPIYAPPNRPKVPVDIAMVAPVLQDAANASVFRWKMVAGFASLAAVAAIGWTSLASLQGVGSSGPQLAMAPAPSSSQGSPTVAVVDAEGQQVMIRDPRLDELLAAHKQFGSTSALQMPAGFLRNATFETPGR